MIPECPVRSDGNQSTRFDSEDDSPPSISFRTTIVDVLSQNPSDRRVTGAGSTTIIVDMGESIFGSFFVEDSGSGIKSINLSSFTDYTCEDVEDGETFEVVSGPNLILSQFANFTVEPMGCVQSTDTVSFTNLNERYSACRDTESPDGVYSFVCQAVNWNNDTSRLIIEFDITE